MIELHIYGSAFGLPSVDINCLATVYLLQTRLQQKEWRLIASNDLNVSPFDELPALKVENIWIAGFRNIARYLESKESEDQRKSQLEKKDQATSEALLTFLENRGLPLLDLSLYVSSDNYTIVTRSVLSDLLSWPQSWTLPSRLRSTARKRSDHLGLSGLDVDAIREKQLKKENEGIAAAIPKSLRITKKSVTGLIGSTAEQTRFRLEAVTADFFEPLGEELGSKPFFTSHHMDTVDCYALALFAQMLIKDMPQPWLRNALQKHQKLYGWTIQNLKDMTDAQSAPLQSTPTKSWHTFATSIVGNLANSMPLTLTSSSPFDQVDQAPVDSSQDKLQLTFKQRHEYRIQQRNQKLMAQEAMSGLIVSLSVFGVLVYAGILNFPWPSRRVGLNFHRFGEAASLLRNK